MAGLSSAPVDLLPVPGLKRQTSPLKKEIQRFVRIITIVAVGFASIFFFAAIFTGFTIIQCFIYFLAILIANVPEGERAHFTRKSRLSRTEIHLKDFS